MRIASAPNKMVVTNSLVAVCSLLAACVSNPAGQPRNETALERALANPSPQLSVLKDSVLRVNDSVGATVRFGDNAAQVSVGCRSDTAQYLYAVSPRRLYPNGSTRYAAPKSLSMEMAKRLSSLPEIADACRNRPDWRSIKTGEVNGSTTGVAVQLDSLQVLESGKTVIWTAFDYPVMSYDPPYNAPYGIKYEKYEIDCKAGSRRILAGYDVDDKSNITDGLVFPREVHKPFATDDDLGPIARELCLDNPSFSGKPEFVPIKKSFPDAQTLAPIDGRVLKEIVAAEIPRSSKRIIRYDVSGTTTYRGKTKPAKQTIEVSPTLTSGLWRITENGQGFRGNSYDFLGLFPVNSSTQFSSPTGGNASQTTELTLTGNWKDMPVGSKLRYRLIRKSVSSTVGSYGGKPSEHVCVVESEVAATVLHASLSGTAKLVKCRDPEDEYERVSTSYYLVDYGLFFNEGTSKNSFFYSNYQISNIEFGPPK